MNPTQANRAYLKMKRKLMERMGYSSIDIPTLRNVHPEFMYAKQRFVNAIFVRIAKIFSWLKAKMACCFVYRFMFNFLCW